MKLLKYPSRLCCEEKLKWLAGFKEMRISQLIYFIQVIMFAFPQLDNCTRFPLPEGTNLEFKISFTSSMAEKIIATLCGILNSGGGYLVIGVEDETRNIIGIKTDKSMDNFLLMLDSIYHHHHLKKINGLPVPLGTIKSGVVQAADNRELLVVTINAEHGEKYTIKDGTIWYRLAASNYKQTTIPNIYSEKEVDVLVAKRLDAHSKVLQQQFDIERREMNQKYMAERNKLKKKFQELENDFEWVIRTTKKTEKDLSDFRELIYNNIEQQRELTEKTLKSNKVEKGILSYLLCCL